jgi:hypothetical protein
LGVDAGCEEGVAVVENVSFYKDAKLALELTAEADWKRCSLYIDPQMRFYFLFFPSLPQTEHTIYSSFLPV